MAQFTGMDIAGVRQLSQQMNAKADEIQSIGQQLTSALQSAQWVGPDRERFLSDWQGQHMQALSRVVEALRDASMRANRNADEQEQASGA